MPSPTTSSSRRGPTPPSRGGGTHKPKPQPTVRELGRVSKPRWRWFCRRSGFAFSGVVALPNGDWLVASSKKLERFDGRNGQPLGTSVFASSYEALAIGPKGRIVAQGTSKGLIELYDRKTQAHSLLKAHRDWINGLAFDPTGRWLISVSQDATTRIWDVAKSTVRLTLPSPEKNNLYSVAIAPNGKLFVVGGYRKLHVYDLQKGSLIASIDGPATAIRSIAFHPDGTRFIAASDTLAIEYDSAKRTVLRRHPGVGRGVLYSPDGTLLLLPRGETIELQELATGRRLFRAKLSSKVTFAAFGPSSRSLVLIQRFNHVVAQLVFDSAPDLGLCVTSSRLYTYGKPELWISVGIIGELPQKTVAYGKLAVDKALDDKGRSVRPVESSIPVMQGFRERNRQYPGTPSLGFALSLRVNGLKPDSLRVARLEGSVLLRVALKSERVVIERFGRSLDKPLSAPRLMAAGVTLRVERSKKGVGVVLRSAGAYDKIENIAVVDEKGTRRGISRGRWFGSAPTWDIAQPESVLAKWKLVVTLTTKAELVRARFDLRDLLVPKRK